VYAQHQRKPVGDLSAFGAHSGKDHTPVKCASQSADGSGSNVNEEGMMLNRQGDDGAISNRDIPEARAAVSTARASAEEISSPSLTSIGSFWITK